MNIIYYGLYVWCLRFHAGIEVKVDGHEVDDDLNVIFLTEIKHAGIIFGSRAPLSGTEKFLPDFKEFLSFFNTNLVNCLQNRNFMNFPSQFFDGIAKYWLHVSSKIPHTCEVFKE